MEASSHNYDTKDSYYPMKRYSVCSCCCTLDAHKWHANYKPSEDLMCVRISSWLSMKDFVKVRNMPAMAEAMKRWPTLPIKYCVFFTEGEKTKFDMAALAYNHNIGRQRQLDLWGTLTI